MAKRKPKPEDIQDIFGFDPAVVKELGEKCYELKKKWEEDKTKLDEAKEDAKQSSSAYKRAVDELQAASRGETFPLMEQVRRNQAAAAGENDDDPDGGKAPVVNDAPGLAVPLRELEIRTRLVEALLQEKIVSVGDLQNWKEDKKLTDIKGIGKAAEGEIEKALKEFWDGRKGS